MPKTITLPLGYDIADNTLGTSALVSGRTYNFTSLFPDEIPGVLGIVENSVGAMCASSAINKWAAFKPTKYAVPSEPKHYHGVDKGPDNHMRYYPPAGGASEPYCPDHFFGYNHNARLPGIKLSGDELYYVDGLNPFSITIALPEFDLRFPVTGGTIAGVIITVSGSPTMYYTPITDADQIAGFIECPYSANVSGEVTSRTVSVQLGIYELGTSYPLCWFPNKASHSISFIYGGVTYEATATVTNDTTVSCEVYHSDAVAGVSTYEFKVFKSDIQDGGTILNMTNDTYTIVGADPQTTYQFQARVNIGGVWRDWIWSNSVQTGGTAT